MIINISISFQQVKYCIVRLIYTEATLAFLGKTLFGGVTELNFSISSFYLLVFPQQFNIYI